jgi:tetratricopeptide (TPR) repeat protein
MRIMTTNCHLRMAIRVLACVSLLACPLAAAAQEDVPSLQKLFEAGKYDGVLQRVTDERSDGNVSPESTYLAAQAARRLEQGERALEEYTRLASSDNQAWHLIGKAGAALESGDIDAALAAATEAVQADGELGFAHYQLGLVQTRRTTYAAAAQSFGRAAELMPAFAYAHYYAGLAFQRIKNINRMATHLESFLKLAPNAPERLSVMAIMKSVRG